MPSSFRSRPVLIAGLPRSGTTWTGRVLAATGATYVHEPDNHLVLPEAWAAKQDLGPFPALPPGADAPAYERLFASAFAGGNRPSLRYSSARLMHRAAPRAGRGTLVRLTGPLAGTRPERRDPPGNVVVKSVFCARSLEWLADRFDPTVVIVTRHPFSVISSWAALGWADFLDRDPAAVADSAARFGVTPPPGAEWIDRAAWHYGYLDAILGGAIARHPEWLVVRHDVLCRDPLAGFRAIAEQVGLGWGDAATEFLLASNRRGRGYSTNRVWSEEIDGWHTRLDPDDQDRVMVVVDRFSTTRALVG